MKIRRFRKQDAQECADLIKNTIVKSGDLKKKEQEQIINKSKPDKLIKKMKTKKYFVCIHNNKIIGIGALDQGEVKTMYVSYRFHRRGVGSLILKKIEKEAKKSKLKKLFLYTHPEAYKFYLKNNFEVIKKYRNEKGLPIVCMEKHLK